MSNEQEPKLSAINADLAAKVKESLGWEYPIDDRTDDEKQSDLKLAIKQMKSLAESDPEIGALEEELNVFLGDKKESLE